MKVLSVFFLFFFLNIMNSEIVFMIKVSSAESPFDVVHLVRRQVLTQALFYDLSLYITIIVDCIFFMILIF
jgi:hypothetical protein